MATEEYKSFTACDTPDPWSLAINLPDETIGIHAAVIKAEQDHWEEALDTGALKGAVVDIAKALSKQFHLPRAVQHPHKFVAGIEEESRRQYLMGAAALSKIVQYVLQPSMEVILAGKDEHVTFSLDMVTENGQFMPRRLHVEPSLIESLLPASDQSVQWYRSLSDDLFVKRNTKADPSKSLIRLMERKNIPLDSLSSQVTLYPYIPSRWANFE